MNTKTPNGTYTPQPVDTSSVELPKALAPLREAIAENAHEAWAVGRLKDGWQWGEARDDGAKTHPCLVPYGELADSEKEYDRVTAEESIKMLLAAGWTLTPPQ